MPTATRRLSAPVSSTADVVTVTGAVLTLTPVVYGSASVTVTAEDPGGPDRHAHVRGGRGRLADSRVLWNTLAGMAGSHLGSARMTEGPRAAAGPEVSADTCSDGRCRWGSVPLAELERLLAGSAWGAGAHRARPSPRTSPTRTCTAPARRAPWCSSTVAATCRCPPLSSAAASSTSTPSPPSPSAGSKC